jgi:hypothetical protein
MEQCFEYDVFLSFSGEDQEFAEGIYRQLTSYGLGLENSQHFLLAATENAMRSDWVKVEYMAFYELFHMKDGERRRFFIIPFESFDRRGLPLFLRLLQLPESVEAIAKIINPELWKKPVAYPEDIGRFEENLFRLFGNHRVGAIDDRLLRQYLGNRVEEMLLDNRLLRKFETVKTLKLNLEALESVDTKSLMGRIVWLLNQMQYSDDPLKVKFLYELVRRTYYPKWSENQVYGFGRAAKAILNWQDVYVSYTNRDAVEVNKKNKRTIKWFLSEALSRDAWERRNLVARVVLRLLKQQNLKVYDEYHEIMDGRDIGVLMETQVKNSFFLIQLLEPASFIAVPGQQNWMFEEYQNFMTSVSAAGEEVSKERFLPVILGESLEAISPAIVPMVYQSWCEHIRSIKHLILPMSDGHELRRRISEIAKHIVTKRHEMLESMQDFEG